jgi:ubiquitin-like domain-containing CTD phosphatase 1
VVLNKPRENKKLLVLDVDFTFFDHKSTAASPLSLRRPYIDSLLVVLLLFSTNGEGSSLSIL